MAHANEQRYTIKGEEAQKQAIKISDAWFDELQKMPYQSSKSFHSFIRRLRLS